MKRRASGKGCGTVFRPVVSFLMGERFAIDSYPRRVILSILCAVLLCPSLALAAKVQVLFSPVLPAFGPFPSDLFTVADPSHNTGLRVNLPLPSCAVRPSDCNNLDVINTLDGFNLQPRLSIPFSGPIDVTTVTSETVFLLSLGSTLPRGNPGGKIIGINQVVWDPATNTLHIESDELLDQHTRYALLVTRGVQDLAGNRVEASEDFERFRHDLNFGQTKNTHLKEYRKALLDALAAVKTLGVNDSHIAVVSVFTTQSATAILEKIRDQIKADTPARADFLLGSGGTRTLFPLHMVAGITFNRQTGTAPAFTPAPVPIGVLGLVPGAVSQLAFGKYLAADYETADKVIPPIGTRSGDPAVQGTNEIFFTLFLPSGVKPADGWPVAIFGHGNGDSKDFGVFFFAARMATKGIATIAINAVGHGGGPLGTLTVRQTDGSTISFPSGGRGIDQNGDGAIAANEGLLSPTPQAVAPHMVITLRDGIQQTVADLMQLVREIEVGMDIDGDGVADLNPSRIYYFGQSLGGIYGTVFLAIEPTVRAGVPNVAGGPFIDAIRLSPTFRSLVEQALAARVPPLTNVGDISAGDLRFNENLPLRNHSPIINNVPGAIAIQEVIEQAEWVNQAGNPVAYAPHLRQQPLNGVPIKSVIYQFARGDQNVPNPTTTAILRAGDLADRATLYRHDLAFADPVRNPNPPGTAVPKNPHIFLFFSPGFFPAVADVARGALQQMAEFFASDGISVIDPDGEEGPLFEVPVIPPLPEDLGFIP